MHCARSRSGVVGDTGVAGIGGVMYVGFLQPSIEVSERRDVDVVDIVELAVELIGVGGSGFPLLGVEMGMVALGHECERGVGWLFA